MYCWNEILSVSYTMVKHCANILNLELDVFGRPLVAKPVIHENELTHAQHISLLE